MIQYYLEHNINLNIIKYEDNKSIVKNKFEKGEFML